MNLINIQKTNARKTRKMANIFLITEKGNGFNEKGIEYIRSTLNDDNGVDANFTVYSGIGINEPDVLAKMLKHMLEQKKESYIVLSANDRLWFYSPDAVSTVCENLKEGADMTSWEVMVDSTSVINNKT